MSPREKVVSGARLKSSKLQIIKVLRDLARSQSDLFQGFLFLAPDKKLRNDGEKKERENCSSLKTLKRDDPI